MGLTLRGRDSPKATVAEEPQSKVRRLKGSITLTEETYKIAEDAAKQRIFQTGETGTPHVGSFMLKKEWAKLLLKVKYANRAGRVPFSRSELEEIMPDTLARSDAITCCEFLLHKFKVEGGWWWVLRDFLDSEHRDALRKALDEIRE